MVRNVRTIAVECWLRRLRLAKSSCAKIGNLMSVLFNHACRYEFFDRNPIRLVRQGAKRKGAPNVLTPEEIKTTLMMRKRFGWHTFRHTYSTLLRSVGTEFQVMQELLRHFSFAINPGCHAQAIMPSKHGAQAAVVCSFCLRMKPAIARVRKADYTAN